MRIDFQLKLNKYKGQTNLVSHGVYGNAEFKGDIVFAVRVSFLPLFHTTGWHRVGGRWISLTKWVQQGLLKVLHSQFQVMHCLAFTFPGLR